MTSGQNPLTFARYYNGLGSLATQVYLPEASPVQSATLAASTGGNWRNSYDRYLKIISSTTVIAERPDGQQIYFTLNGSNWTTDSDLDVTLTQSGTQWTLTDSDDTAETYTTVPLVAGYLASSLYAQLNSIRSRNGYTQTLTYSGASLSSVTDSYNRSLAFTYTGGLMQSMTTPDGLVVTYSYAAAGTGSHLTGVSYSTTPATTQSYVYEIAAQPLALTGVIDENGNRYATWGYDAIGHGTSSQLGTGANAMATVYNSDASRTVTNALGVVDTYKFTTLQNIPKVTEIDRAATATTAAATELFTYDSNGYLASQTDWNGNKTTFVNNAHGEPTTINEAVGSAVARTTTIAYDSTWVHLPATISTPGVDVDFTYDSNGEQLTKTLKDTTASAVPYATGGQTRKWTNAWSNFLLASSQTPNGNKTKFGYDSSGALTSVTDALSHVTQITAHTGGGLPKTIVDPNGVTTTRVYDGRQRVTSSKVAGTTGTYTTTLLYDLAGNLTTTTLPDGSYLTNAYDTAHRLTKTTDALGNYITYMLDAFGDRTQANVYRNGGTLTWQRADTFDALGRSLVDTAGAGQITTSTYDLNGNLLSVKDGLGHTTTSVYDALNRPSKSTDANGGATVAAYDTHNRIVSVTDANGNATSYLRDGFGEVIQLSSPDSGMSVFHYDLDSNLTSKTDALGIVTNQTFDALERPLTTTYPASTAENVTYTYDQTGTGFSFGIGRLTSVTDAAGSLTRSYEERGNLLSEVRVNGATTLTTGYAYDGANRVSSMAYPDGTLVTYLRNAAGYLSTVTAKPAGAASATTIATLNHQPFGPINSITYGNGIAETWAFDQAYRPTSIVDALSGVNLQNLTYGYDLADNVKSITDAVNAANSQTLGYDPINRLASATSGSGGYGSFAWTYDPVGNRLKQVQGSTTTTYGYTSGTNRLATITVTGPSAALRMPPKTFHLSGMRATLATSASARTTATAKATQSPNPKQQSSSILAGTLGWPLLLGGLTGVLTFRKRLLVNRLLGVIFLLALLTGGATLLNGCGSGVNAVATSTTAGPTTLSPPTFSPGAGTYSAPQTVTLTDSNAGASIFYTTDGTTPTNSSTLYAGPITVSSTKTIQAFAVAAGSANSSVATATYTISIAPTPTAATPTFLPGAGTFTAPQTVTLADSTSGAAIYFTIDGTTPTASANQYTGPFVVGSTATIKAIAIASGYTNSAVATSTYTISIPPTPIAATPTFSPGAGTYTAAQTVTLSDTTPGATIYYTVNGATPSTDSTQYTAPITVSSSETIQVVAVASGYTNSAVASAAYTISIPPVGTAATPVFSPAAGTYGSPQTVTLSDSTAGATIYYTVNGATPSTGSTLYTVPITVSSSTTLQAVAVASGYTNSAVASAVYTISMPPVGTAATPVFSPAAGTYSSPQTVTLSDSTAGATIYYTTNGTTPTTSSTPYTAPIAVGSTENLQAIAVASSYTNSAVAAAAYTISIPTVATPTFSPAAGTYTSTQTVTISDATAGATLYYTTDGTTPTSNSTKYTAPLTVSSSDTVTAIATATGDTTSAVASAVYTINNPNDITVTTNANGNITSIPPANSAAYATFSYNNANRLSSVTGSPTAAVFVYDWSGQRYSKANPGSPATVYSYMQGGALIAENNGTVTDYIYADGRPIATLQPAATPAANQINYIVADRLGTPQLASNSSGATTWATSYQPFGTTGTISASVTQNLRFPGQNADTETGFNYNLTRDYMPNVGRYLQSDPLGINEGINTYLYAGGSPFEISDPTGLAGVRSTVLPLFYCSAWGACWPIPGMRQGVNLEFTVSPEQALGGSLYTGPDGEYVVEGEEKLFEGPNAIPPGELAREIWNDPAYSPGDPVRLLICNSGKDGFAQKVANELGKLASITGRSKLQSSTVTGPNGFYWLPFGQITQRPLTSWGASPPGGGNFIPPVGPQ